MEYGKEAFLCEKEIFIHGCKESPLTLKLVNDCMEAYVSNKSERSQRCYTAYQEGETYRVVRKNKHSSNTHLTFKYDSSSLTTSIVRNGRSSGDGLENVFKFLFN